MYLRGWTCLSLVPSRCGTRANRCRSGGPSNAVPGVARGRGRTPGQRRSVIDDVLGDDAPEGTRRSVQTLVSMIRRELGDVVQQAAGGYVLDCRDRDDRRCPVREQGSIGARDGRDQSGTGGNSTPGRAGDVAGPPLFRHRQPLDPRARDNASPRASSHCSRSTY